MRTSWWIAAAFSGGLALGALGAGALWAHTLPIYNRHVVQLNFAIEQEFRATRAERLGDMLAALHHQRNSVEAESEEWLHLFGHWEPVQPWFPLVLLAMEGIAVTDGEYAGVAEALQRGQLARLLDLNGYAERAAEEWRRAGELWPRSLEHLRKSVAGTRADMEAEWRVQAEIAVLGQGPQPSGE